MYPKNPFFQKCLIFLESLPNIKATIQGEPYFSSEVLADGELIISTSNKTTNYICEIKTGITNHIVDQVAEYFANLGKRLNNKQRPLLVTRSLSSLVVDRLLERDIEFIDIDGNIYLNSSDIYIAVRNQTFKDNTNKSLEITAAALQVMCTLLTYPQKLISTNNNFDKQISDIADMSGVTAKTVKSTLKKLQDLDFIRREKRGYGIVDYVKLLERWEFGYAERLRAKLLIETYSPIGKQSLSEIENMIKMFAGVYKYSIGGEFAASIITGHLRPSSVTLHLHKETIDYHREIAVSFRLKPNPEGNITFFQDIGQYGSSYEYGGQTDHIINPLLIHAELVRTGDSRLKETAQLIFDKYIEEIAQR
ncbi:MAG: hypothetical protein DCE90_03870 [Pseudanabaena sp.]|nr:MAG: hypothetical protein DCE90_03870 [Pseudanabaena sp.]